MSRKDFATSEEKAAWEALVRVVSALQDRWTRTRWSGKKLAARAGVSPATVTTLFTGRRWLRLSSVEGIADALGCRLVLAQRAEMSVQEALRDLAVSQRDLWHPQVTGSGKVAEAGLRPNTFYELTQRDPSLKTLLTVARLVNGTLQVEEVRLLGSVMADAAAGVGVEAAARTSDPGGDGETRRGKVP